MKKIAVVGCGWLGSSLANELLNKGYEVHGTSRDIDNLVDLIDSGMVAHQLEYENMDTPQDWLKECEVLVLNIPPSGFRFLYAEKMVAIAKNIRPSAHLLFISSTSVYADNDGIVTENTPAEGGKRNGNWVIDAEQALQKHFAQQLCIIRMSGLVGGKRHPVNYMSGKSYDFGGNPVNLIHREDCVGLIRTVIEKEITGVIINGVCEENPTREEYYTFAAKQLNINPPLFLSSKAKNFKKIESLVRQKIGYKMKYGSPFDFPVG
jgi:nucleoside-diphosphate-sugar epimerase